MDAKKYQETDVFVQKKILNVPNQFQIFLSVKIEVDSNEWDGLSSTKRRLVWLKSRNQLYWSCDNSINSLSLCNSSGIITSTSLTIDFYDVLHSLRYLQCSICFLKESSAVYGHGTSISPHIERIVFDLHQYLPPHLSNDQSTVQLQITRIDRMSVYNEIGKIFITNISFTDVINDNDNSIFNNNCRFYCGWGPKCLLQIGDVCNTKLNCVNGEDEDDRLCKAIKNGIISIKYDFNPTTPANTSRPSILSTMKDYLIVIICVAILLALLIFIGWFMCRNCEADNRFGGSVKKLNSTVVTPDSDTSCSTCEMKSKMHSAEFSSANSKRSRKLLSTQQTRFPDRGDRADLHTLKINRKESRFTALSSNSHNFTDKESLKQLCHNPPYYSNRDRAIQSSEWLNLFFHVSNEARHKSLVKQPPPNVNNNNSEIIINNKNHNFSTTPLTCVFLVMI